MKRILFWWAVVSFGCVLGCSHGQLYRPVENFPKDRALIFFYRPEGLGIKGGNLEIKGLEGLIGKLRYQGYFTYLARPGSQTFFHDSYYGFDKITLDLRPGETYYLRFYAKGIWNREVKFELVPEALARIELLDCRCRQ